MAGPGPGRHLRFLDRVMGDVFFLSFALRFSVVGEWQAVSSVLRKTGLFASSGGGLCLSEGSKVGGRS